MSLCRATRRGLRGAQCAVWPLTSLVLQMRAVLDRRARLPAGRHARSAPGAPTQAREPGARACAGCDGVRVTLWGWANPSAPASRPACVKCASLGGAARSRNSRATLRSIAPPPAPPPPPAQASSAPARAPAARARMSARQTTSGQPCQPARSILAWRPLGPAALATRVPNRAPESALPG